MVVEWLAVWGVKEVGGFLFEEVFLPLAQGTLEDYTKDFFKDCISDVANFSPSTPFKNAVGKALKEFLLLLQEELEYRDISKQEIKKKYKKAVKQFVYDDEVKPILGRAFEPICKINAEALALNWQGLSLPPLPEKFDWEQVAKQYVRKVKALLREDEELRAILDSQHQEMMSQNIQEMAGVAPEFNLRQYRESLQEFYGNIPLDTLHPSGYEYKVKLWRVFVPQTVRESLPLYDFPKDYLQSLEAEDLLEVKEDLSKHREQYFSQPTRSVLEVVEDGDCQYVVILGDPGSGKSTLTRYLAVNWLENPSKTLPLLIELRKYSQDRNLPKDFLEFFHQGSEAICRLNQNQLHERLRAGDALVMFDGLDEVFNPGLREAIRTEIIRFTNEYPQVKVIVTSRIIGYKAQKFRDAQFRHFTLQDLEQEQVQEFITKWHDLAFGVHPDKERLKGRLQAAVANSPAIKELAGNPLLLTMMAILNRHQDLPRDRAELYEEASKVLLHNWEVEKNLAIAPDTIGRAEKQAMLRKIAHFMQAAPSGLKGNLIKERDLVAIITEYLKTLEVGDARAKAKLIIKQLRERNFILCFTGEDTYAFVHRTFLEYFCAWEFVWQFKEEQILRIEGLKEEVFGKHWADESWHEVLRLIVGMIESRFGEEIIEFLMGLDGERVEFVNLFLAADCLREVKNRALISGVDKRLLERMKALIKRGASSAKALEKAINSVAITWTNDPDTIAFLKQAAISNDNWQVCIKALEEIAKGWKDEPDTLAFLKQTATSDDSGLVRLKAFREIVRGYKDNPDVLTFIKQAVSPNDASWVLYTVVQKIAKRLKDEPDTLPFLKQVATSNDELLTRCRALEEIAKGWKDEPDTLPFLKQAATSDDNESVRYGALQEIAKGWKDEPDTLPFLKQAATSDDNWSVRSTALEEIAEGWKDEPWLRAFLSNIAINDPFKREKEEQSNPRQTALEFLVKQYPNHPQTLELLKDRAENDNDEQLREYARGIIDN